MPKGVYNRSKTVTTESIQPISQPMNSGDIRVNTVKVHEMPNRQSANANVESLRQTHGDEDVSTTERLFGSPEQQDAEIEQQPVRDPEPVAQNPDQAEEPRFKEAAEAAPEPKPAESTQTDDFIDWEKMSGKKIRQKIDGKEVVTTVEELKKYSDQDQIKKHLAEAADKVGQERRKLAEERQQWEQLKNQAPQGTPQSSQNQQIPELAQSYQSQNQDPYFQRIQYLEQQIQQLAQGVQPSIYESNRQRVANELRAQGFNDFMEYLPKMEMALTKIGDPNLTRFYDTPEGSKSLYFQLKAQDLQQAPKSAPQSVPRETVAIAPPATQIDGGAQSSGHYVDDSAHQYRTAFRKATSLGDDREAWNNVLRQKIPHILGE